MSIEEDDRIIAKYTKLLGLDKKLGKNSFNKFLKNDGLEDLFDFADTIDQNYVKSRNQDSTRKRKTQEKSAVLDTKKKKKVSVDDLLDDTITSEKQKSKPVSESDKNGADTSTSDNGDEASETLVEQTEPQQSDPKASEENDKFDNFVASEKKYVPPHLRKKLQSQPTKTDTSEVQNVESADIGSNLKVVAATTESHKILTNHQKQLNISKNNDTFRSLRV